MAAEYSGEQNSDSYFQARLIEEAQKVWDHIDHLRLTGRFQEFMDEQFRFWDAEYPKISQIVRTAMQEETTVEGAKDTFARLWGTFRVADMLSKERGGYTEFSTFDPYTNLTDLEGILISPPN